MTETTERKHSPTPWVMGYIPNSGEYTIYDAETRRVARMESLSTTERAETDYANAIFIVEAVNAYDKLRADYDQMNGIAADLQRSRAKIIEDNNHLREIIQRMISELSELNGRIIFDASGNSFAQDESDVVRIDELLTEARKSIGAEVWDD